MQKIKDYFGRKGESPGSPTERPYLIGADPTRTKKRPSFSDGHVGVVSKNRSDAYHALCLVSRAYAGDQHLHEDLWDVLVTTMLSLSSLSLPRDITKHICQYVSRSWHPQEMPVIQQKFKFSFSYGEPKYFNWCVEEGPNDDVNARASGIIMVLPGTQKEQVVADCRRYLRRYADVPGGMGFPVVVLTQLLDDDMDLATMNAQRISLRKEMAASTEGYSSRALMVFPMRPNDSQKVVEWIEQFLAPPPRVMGRPFNVKERKLVTVPTTGGDPNDRTSLAAKFEQMGQLEHASISSFSVFSLNLLACGAPMDLLEAAHRAALDEVRHAELAFGLASRFAGRTIAPAAMEEKVTVRVTPDLQHLAQSTAQEACIGETLSCIVMAAELAQETDEEVVAVLTEVIADEMRHAALGWQTVKWAIGKDQTLRDDIIQLFREQEEDAIEPLIDWLVAGGDLPQLTQLIHQIVKG